MMQGTTPTHTYILPIATSDIAALRITYKQNKDIVLEKEKTDVKLSGNTISLDLTQEETLMFDENIVARIQIHGRTKAGKAFASKVMRVPVYELLNKAVI